MKAYCTCYRAVHIKSSYTGIFSVWSIHVQQGEDTHVQRRQRLNVEAEWEDVLRDKEEKVNKSNKFSVHLLSKKDG